MMNVVLDPKIIRNLESIHRKIMKAQVSFSPLAKTIKQIQDTIFLPYVRLNEQLQNAFKPYIEANERISKQIQISFLPYVRLNEQLRKAFKPYIEINEKLTKQIQSNLQPYIQTIQALQEHINNISRISGPISFKDALEEVSKAYEEAQKKAKGEQNAAINIVIQKVEVKIEDGPKGALSFEFVISLLFSLILCVVSLQTSGDSEVRTTQHISRIEEKVDQLATFLYQKQNDATIYIVSRPVNFRNKPSTKGSVVIAVLPVSQKVEIVERKGKWIYVRYFDGNEGVYNYGWVFKKYLRLVKQKMYSAPNHSLH